MNYYLLFRINIFLYYIIIIIFLLYQIIIFRNRSKQHKTSQEHNRSFDKGKRGLLYTEETLGEQNKGGSIDNLTDRA